MRMRGDGTVEGSYGGGHYIGDERIHELETGDGMKCKRSGRGEQSSKRGSKHLVRDPAPDWISG